MMRKAVAVWIAFGGLAAAVGCGGRSVSIGGDMSGAGGEPVGEPFTGGTPASGGALTTGGATTGGAFPTGGFSGTGFAATGGVTGSGGSIIPQGGTATSGTSGATGVNGGASTIPGGTSGEGSAEGGDGGVIDPYPPVGWDGEEGYRDQCPNWGDTWGYSCWNASYGGSRSCVEEDLAPEHWNCNACSCHVPCETSADCPSALDGQQASCITSSMNNVRSCFILCDSIGRCPTGMSCSPHPGHPPMRQDPPVGYFAQSVCVWLYEVIP